MDSTFGALTRLIFQLGLFLKMLKNCPEMTGFPMQSTAKNTLKIRENMLCKTLGYFALKWLVFRIGIVDFGSLCLGWTEQNLAKWGHHPQKHKCRTYNRVHHVFMNSVNTNYFIEYGQPIRISNSYKKLFVYLLFKLFYMVRCF